MSDEPDTDINVIMSLDPMDLTRQDRNRIVAYQRNARAQREAGVKTKKEKVAGPQLNIMDLLSKVPRPTPIGPQIKRRV